MEQFFKLYKFLFEEEYKNLSLEAKVLYVIMLDRVDLSYKNNLIDDNGKPYIYMKIDEIREILNCGKNKVINELENINLINKIQQGFNKANKIYIENIG